MTADPAEPFYAAIRANADDDLPRLVFADWLDENGQPERAEYIRLSCALAREPEADQTKAIQSRAHQLFQAFKGVWFGQLLEAFRQYRLDRGFLTSVAGADRLLLHADDLLRFAPCLEKVGIGSVRADAGAYLSCEFVHRITHLLLQDVSPPSLDTLSAHIELPNLTELFVQTVALNSVAEGKRFVDWCLPRRVPGLRLSIGFGGTGGGDPSRLRLSATRTFLERHLDLPNLAALRIWGVIVPVAQTLVRWPGLNLLTELNLHDCCVDDEAILIVLPALVRSRLHVLRLGNNSLTDSSVAHIARHELPLTLHELHLDRNRIGDRGVDELIASPHLRDDLVLHIGNNVFGGRSAARLRERFPNVRF